MPDARILTGDCLALMPTFDAASVDAIVCDPPYGLKFMGKTWDHGVPGVPFWKAALDVAKPGAHLVAFGGTRKYHRLTCAIEDAGWEIRDCLSWLYGSGFPKSHNGAWGGTALKPAWEPVILTRKPLVGTVAANVERFGTGALNIDGCRIGAGQTVPGGGNAVAHRGGIMGEQVPGGRALVEPHDNGRWPANVCLDEEAAAMLDEQSGERPAKMGGSSPRSGFWGNAGPCDGERRDDTGGASRFFYTAKAGRSERNAGVEHRDAKPLNWSSGTQSPGTFQAEGTNRSAANNHPTVKPLALMQWLCRLVTPKGGLILDPFCGSGSTGRAAVAEGFSFIGIELDAEYAEIARARITEYAPLFGDVA